MPFQKYWQTDQWTNQQTDGRTEWLIILIILPKIEQQRCSRTGKVQKNHKILKKNTIFNEHPVIRFVPIDSSLYLKSLGCSHRELVGSLLQGYGSKARVIFLPVNLSICLSICLSVKYLSFYISFDQSNYLSMYLSFQVYISTWGVSMPRPGPWSQFCRWGWEGSWQPCNISTMRG